MYTFITRRILEAIVVLFGVSILVFFMLHFAPGDPVRILFGTEGTMEDVERMRKSLGLDRPIWVQYYSFLTNLFRGDLGTSLRTGLPVADEIGKRIIPTLELALVAFGLAVLLGILGGLVAATSKSPLADRTTMLVAVIGVAVPAFWLGLLLQLLFAFRLDLFPVSGRAGPLTTLAGLGGIVLPATTLAVAPMAYIARLTRSSMLEVLGNEYVRTARAKGLPERIVVAKHALRNASLTIITWIGLQLGYMLGGSIVVETVFSWPGLGRLLAVSVFGRDFPMVQAAALLFAIIFITLNLLVDLAVGFLDPRVRYD